MVGASAEEYAGKVLLVVDVLRSFDIYADKQGRATRRIGTDCIPHSPQEHRRLREERLASTGRPSRPPGRSPTSLPEPLVAARELCPCC
jgi:hypothetical protein